MFLGTYRPEDLVKSWDGKEHPLSTTLKHMSRERLYETIQLERLSESRGLIDGILGDNNLDQEFMNRIQMEAGGNPFFVIELIQLLQGDDLLQQGEDGAWTLSRPIREIQIPSRIYDIVTNRLEKLKKEKKEVLECASVIGEEFQPDVMEEVLELKRIRLLKDLAEIEREHRLIHSKGQLYRFDHAKIKEVLYTDLSDSLRQEYHRLIAGSLEKLYPEQLNELVDKLAHHYYEAKDPKAVDYAIVAGNMNKEKYANKEAMRLYKMALEGIEEGDERTMDIHKGLGQVCFMAGEWNEAIHHMKWIVDSCMDMADNQGAAWAHRNLADMYEARGSYDEAIGEADKAAGLYMEVEDKAGEADALRLRGKLHWRRGELDKGLEVLERAFALAEELGDKGLLGRIHSETATVYYQMGNHAGAEKDYLRAIDLLEDDPDRFELFRAIGNLGENHCRNGDLDKAIEYMERANELAHTIGSVRGEAMSFSNLAEYCLEKGYLERAEECCDKALPILERLGDQGFIASTRMVYGMIHHRKREWQEASREFNKAIAICKETHNPDILAQAHLHCGEMLKDKGDITGAREQIKKAKETWQGIGNEKRGEQCERVLEGLVETI
jgi:predicted ATPase